MVWVVSCDADRRHMCDFGSEDSRDGELSLVTWNDF